MTGHRYGLDIETYGRNGWQPASRLISVAIHKAGAKKPWFFPLCHPELPGWGDDSYRGEGRLPSLLVEILLDESNELICHNAFFDIAFLESRLKMPARAKLFCTLIAASLIDETSTNDLDTVAQKYVGKGKIAIDVNKLWKLPLLEVQQYNENDARLMVPLSGQLKKELLKRRAIRDLYYDVRMPLLRNLLDAHLRGIGVDLKETEVRQDLAQRKIIGLEKKLHAFAAEHKVTWWARRKGEDIEEPFTNPGSQRQLVELLKKVGAKLTEVTEKGAVSTSMLSLKRARRRARQGTAAWEVLDAVLEMRKLSKALSGFLVPLAEQHAVKDGRAHPLFSIGRGVDEVAAKGKGKSYSFGTVTGRLSSSEPNIQQVPNGHLVKDLFVPSKGWLLGEVDYSQIELRVAAYLSRDPRLMSVFSSGKDMHSMILSQITGERYEDVRRWAKEQPEWKEKRITAKKVVFGGLLYGAWVDTIADSIERDLDKDVSKPWVDKLLRELRRTHQAYFRWEQGVRLLLCMEGTVTAPFGMTRHLEHVLELDAGAERSRAERQAVNFLIQNTAAEITYRAINRLCKRLPPEKWRFLTTVHDQVLFEHKRGQSTRRLELEIRDEMTKGVRREMLLMGIDDADDLTLEVEVSLGKPSWGAQED